MKEKVNPAVAAVTIVVLVALASFFIWRGVQGPSGNGTTDPAVKESIKKTTQEIPNAAGAAPGMTMPPQKSSGVSTPLMPAGGMTAPPNH